jgi:uncharacterized membrane protein
VSEWSFTFAVPGGVGTALGLGLLLLAVLGATLWELRREPRRARRWALGGLRAATALAAWAVAVQPRWVAERFEQTEGRLAVLVDASRSMSLPRVDTSRAERAQALLGRWAEAADGPVATFTFGERLAGADLDALSEELAPRQDRSRLGPALEALLAQEPRDLGAVVVVSDGGGAEPLDPEVVARHGVRVHAVATAEDDLRDDAVAEVQADPVGFLRRSARVRVVVRSLGGPGGPIPVTLRRGDQVEREVVADVPADGEVEVDIPFTPTRLGREVYRVSIPQAPGDAVPENNERAFLVRVTRDKLRVLLVAGQPSWDQRFLRAFLERDPATDLISFFILRNTHDLTMAGPDELALIPFPTDELFNEHLGSFDLVIFQNFEYGPYQMASYLPRIRDYVLRGGSFAMIGGPLSFHSGGYAQTPIAEILPVDLPPPGTPTARTQVEDRFQPRLADGMERHPLLELLPDPSQNVGAWARLAPLDGANVVARVRPEGTTLLEHPEHRMESGGPLPVLVLGTAGQGRTLALTTDTTWRWGITTGGQTGDASAYERFWDRAVRWLARDPALEPARVDTDRERYGPGATAALEAHLRDARYQPHAEEVVSFAIVDAAGEARTGVQARTDREGRAEATVELPSRPGAYRVEARLPGRPDPVARQWLIVEAGGDELADPRAHPERLAALAAATGGRFFGEPEDAPPLHELDATRTRSLGTAERAPLASVWAFALLVGLFLAEWVLRRRWGRR